MWEMECGDLTLAVALSLADLLFLDKLLGGPHGWLGNVTLLSLGSLRLGPGEWGKAIGSEMAMLFPSYLIDAAFETRLFFF